MKLCLLTLSLFIGWSVHAEQVYLLFASECGQQIRYRRSVERAPAPDYYAYVFPDAQDGSRYLLETDGQGTGTRTTLPDSYLSCATAVLSSRMIDRINAGTDQLTILIAAEDGRAYQVQPVVMAAVLQQRGDQITYRSPLATFAFDTRLTVIGENIDRAGEGATVFFEGQEGAHCESSYLFVQHHPNTAYPSITYRLSPTLGITQRSLEGNGTYSKTEEITAVEVNGVPLASYLSEQCIEVAVQAVATSPVTDYVPLYVEPTTVAENTATEATDVPTETPPPATYSAPAAAANEAETHRVAAGETLYQISQRYGIEVNTLKSINGLTTNTIYVGQELLLEARNEPISTEKLVSESAFNPPANALAQPVSSSVVSNDYHVVQPGETIASLALRFGYTERRFREFNHIIDQRVALVGQRLKTSHCACPTAYTPPVDESGLASTQVPEYADDYALPPPPSPDRPEYTPIVVPPARPLLTGGAQTAPPGEAAAPLPPAYGGGRTVHVVQEGQSLYAIARQYGVGVADLQQLNGLGPSDVIVPFQKLYVN